MKVSIKLFNFLKLSKIFNVKKNHYGQLEFTLGIKMNFVIHYLIKIIPYNKEAIYAINTCILLYSW